VSLSEYGELTLSDLENRAATAFQEHLDGYTASSVLHNLFMQALDTDPELTESLDHVMSVLRDHHDRTRAVWHTARRAWFLAAEIPFDENDEAELR
jgi:hypothetical protein